MKSIFIRQQITQGVVTQLIVKALLILVFFSSSAFGAVFLDGSTTNCNDGSTNYSPTNRACGSGSDTVYNNLSSFSSNITAGSTNFMRAGSYFRDTGNRLVGSLYVSSSKSGTSGNPTIIKAYTGEELKVVIGTQTRQATYNSNPSDASGAGSWNYYPNPAVLTYDASYITIDGIKAYGQTWLGGGHDVLVQNSDLGGGGGVDSISEDQGNTVRLINIYNVTLKNNKIHHNSRRFEDNNGTLIIGYTFSAVIDHNTFTDVYGTTFEDKDGTGQAGRTTEVKYNFFGPTTISSIDSVGVRGFNQAQETSNQYIHNNIFYNKTVGINVIGAPAVSNLIYNNTFVNCGTDINQPANNIAGGFFSSNNNIFYHSGSGQTFLYTYDLAQIISANWNIYYNTGTWATYSTGSNTTLASWQSTSSKDANTVVRNPNFVSPTGTTAVDFKRSSYADGFSGSPYSVTAGAYITGKEVIGATLSGANQVIAETLPEESQQVTVTVPSPPRDLKNVQ